MNAYKEVAKIIISQDGPHGLSLAASDGEARFT